MVDTLPVCEHTKLRNPEMSRVVDFSKNDGEKPGYDSSQINKVILRSLAYDTLLSHWKTTTNSNYPYSEFHNNNMPGDFYFLIEDIGTLPPPTIRFFNRSAGPETFFGIKCETYGFSGSHRRFQERRDTRRVEMTSFDIPSSTGVKYILGGFTLPINTALYLGMKGSGGLFYQWQSDSSGNLTTLDAATACRSVTRSACEKLKADWGKNIRIYLIKYRKQPNYKHSISDSTVTLDYSYLDDCASGVIAPYLWDVSSEADLKSALSAIAADIKSFAAYAPARGVR
jgi:hypothetical protein